MWLMWCRILSICPLALKIWLAALQHENLRQYIRRPGPIRKSVSPSSNHIRMLRAHHHLLPLAGASSSISLPMNNYAQVRDRTCKACTAVRRGVYYLIVMPSGLGSGHWMRDVDGLEISWSKFYRNAGWIHLAMNLEVEPFVQSSCSQT